MEPIKHGLGRQRQVEAKLGLLMNAAAQCHGGGQQPARLDEKPVQLGHVRDPR
jgi:hypothetical protein